MHRQCFSTIAAVIAIATLTSNVMARPSANPEPIGAFAVSGDTLAATANVSTAADDRPPRTYRGHVEAMVGYRGLDAGWSPGENQLLLGFAGAFEIPGLWAQLDTGFLLSHGGYRLGFGGRFGDGALLYELLLGGGRYWVSETGRFWYVGAGPAFVWGELTRTDLEGTDVGVAAYARAGCGLLAVRGERVGLDLRYDFGGRLTPSGRRLSVKGLQVALTLGHALRRAR